MDTRPDTIQPDSCCPPLESLEAFASGTGVADAVGVHIARCRACADVVEAARFTRQFAAVMADMSENTGRAASDPGRVPPRAVGYQFIGEIARGGQGVVYRAEQLTTGRAVAVKVLHHHPATGGGSMMARARFLREIQIAASLSHPGIVRLLDSLTLADGRDALIMELIDGVALDEWTENPPGLTEGERLSLLAEIADALAHAHQRGVIHRDLKPSNILVDPAGRPRVLDFGVARRHETGDGSDRLTLTGEFTGTLAYAAPEQVLRGATTPDVRSDIYALGVIGFRVLTGRLPYEVDGSLDSAIRNILTASPPTRTNAGISTDSWTVLSKAMAKEPGRRYASASDLAADLRRAASGQAIAARGDSGWYVLRKAARRHRVALGLAASVLVGLVGVLIALAMGNERLGEALRQSRLQQVRAHVAGDARERAGAILWPEIGRSIPAGADPAASLWHAPLARRELLWAFVEMQSRATCVAETGGDAGSAVVLDSLTDGRFGIITADKRIAWLGLEGDVPVLSEGPRLSASMHRGWFSPSGERVVTIEPGWLRCIDTRSGATLGEMAIPDGLDRTARVSIAEWGVAIASTDGRLVVASLPDMTVLHETDGLSPGQVPWLDPAARVVTYLGSDAMLVTADIDAGTSVFPLAAPIAEGDPPPTESQVLVTPDRRAVVVAHSGGVLVAGINDGAASPRVLLRPGYRVSASLSPDGSVLAAQAFGDSTLRLWKTGTREELPGLPGHHDTVVFHAFSTDGTRIVTTDRAGVLRVWTAPGHGWRRALGQPTSRTHQFALAGGALLASDARGRLVGLPADGAGVSATAPPHPPAIAAVMVSGAGSAGLAAAANLDDRITLFDWPPSGQAPRTLRLGAGDAVRGLVFGPPGVAGAPLAACTSAGRVVRIDTAVATITAEAAPAGRVHASELRWSPDGSRIAVSFRDGRVAILHADTLRTEHLIAVSETQVRSIAYAPDGRTLAAVGDSGRLIIIDAATGRVRSAAQVSENSLFTVAFHHSGRTIAVGDRAGLVTVIDAAASRSLASVKADGAVMMVAFSPEGDALFVAALDCAVQRWDFTMLAGTMPALRQEAVRRAR